MTHDMVFESNIEAPGDEYRRASLLHHAPAANHLPKKIPNARTFQKNLLSRDNTRRGFHAKFEKLPPRVASHGNAAGAFSIAAPRKPNLKATAAGKNVLRARKKRKKMQKNAKKREKIDNQNNRASHRTPPKIYPGSDTRAA